MGETVWNGEFICTGSNSGCKGHNAYDLTFWATVTKIDGVYQKTHLTNQEVRDAVRPSNYSMPYIYDHFDWPRCHGKSKRVSIGTRVAFCFLFSLFLGLRWPV